MKTKYAQFLEDVRYKSVLQIWNEQSFFNAYEIVPQLIYEERGEKVIELFSPRAILSLVETRILANRPITINTWHNRSGGFEFRGYRPIYYYTQHFLKEYQQDKISLTELLDTVKKLCKYSQHTLFNAFDYNVKDTSAEKFRLELIQWKQEGKLPFLTGIEKDVTWIHNDYRLCTRLDENNLFLF